MFWNVAKTLLSACLHCKNDDKSFTIKKDASDLASAILNHNRRPVILKLCALTRNENKYSADKIETTAIIEAVRKFDFYDHERALYVNNRQTSYHLNVRLKIKN